MDIEKLTTAAVSLTKSPLGILALFIVLIYGFAALVVGSENNNLEDLKPLIYFMLIFPHFVFFGFIWLVAKHHTKLYGPSDYKHESNFIASQYYTIASLAAASVKNSYIYSSTSSNVNIKRIVDSVLNNYKKQDKPEAKKIIWIDDNPSNNIYEREALESQGITVDIADSSAKALDMISRNKYSLVISDLDREGNPKEGFILLEKLRSGAYLTPFLFYTGSATENLKNEAISKGADGLIDRPLELFSQVMKVLGSVK
ncbi:response regulator [Modicisalibacter luteus]|uniref:Response regulator n=3 Tax=Modicisalibacter luteus TaxID=453962 RepID=A0ABV7LVP3_9GAMM|nr:hypothetical protein GCM10007159_36960 [Halomonas lutea]